MDNFIEIYKKWLESRKWAAQKELTWEHRVKLNAADRDKKKAWNSLPENRRRDIVSKLIQEGILPHSVLATMDIFDARVIGI